MASWDQTLTCSQPSTPRRMELPLRNRPSHPLHHPLRRLCLLGIESRQSPNPTIQHLESTLLRHPHARHLLLLHESRHLLLVHEHLHANHPRRQPHQSRRPIPAPDNRWLCKRLLRRLARPPRTGPSHHRNGLSGHGHHQRPPLYHPRALDLLGNGLPSNVRIRLHHRLDHD